MDICLIHVSRTGSHAVQNWLCHQLPGGVKAEIDCMGAGLKGRKTLVYGGGEHRLYMLENFDINGWDEMGFAGRFDKIGIIVRDPYNWMASTWRQEKRGNARYIKVPWPEQIRKDKGFPKWFGATLGQRDMMIQHLKHLLGDDDLLGERYCGINYTRWTQAREYRREVAAYFGVEEFTDKGLSEVPPHGGGSSWTRREKLAPGVTLSRWEEYADNKEFRRLVSPELRELGERYFGMSCPWDEEKDLGGFKWDDAWFNPKRHHGKGRGKDQAIRDRLKTKYLSAKYETALKLKPKKIVEIGVQCGYGARAFLEACPEAEYIGFDVLPPTHNFISWAKNLLRDFNVTIHHLDTQKTGELWVKDVDLFHVDGSHKSEHCYHDMNLAVKCIRPGGAILADDVAHRSRKPRPAYAGFKKWIDENNPKSVTPGGAFTGDMLVIM